MTTKPNWTLFIPLFILSTWLLISCQASPLDTSNNGLETPAPFNQEPIDIPQDPLEDSLVICLRDEPSSLYPYGDRSGASQAVREAIFDGPYDNLSYELQSVLIQRMPSLSNGDAVINKVLVSEGDLVLSENAPRNLEVGSIIRPAGCNAEICEIIYDGGEIEMDQMEVQFTLIPDLLWSDGAALTAADSVYAYDLAKHPDTPISKSILDRTASYRAVNDLTLTWTGIPGFLDQSYLGNFWAPMPQHLWGELSAVELLTAEISTRAPIGWGAYIVEEWIPGQSILLKSNPYYFRAVEGLPSFETLVFRFLGNEANDAIDSILSGECDLIDSSIDLSKEIARMVDLQEQGELFTTFSTSTSWEVLDLGIHPISYDNGYSIYLGDRPDFFSDVRTRQAIASCLDRQKVVDTIFFGQSVVLDSYIPPQHPLFNSNTEKYPFDIETGIDLLEQVGWVLNEGNVRIASGIENVPDGTRFEINYWTTKGVMNQHQKAAEQFAANLTACGIRVNLEIYSIDELYEKAPDGPLFGRNYDLAQYPWHIGQTPPCSLFLSNGISGDPYSNIAQVSWLADALPNADPSANAFPQGWGGWNTPGYANPAYDAACSAALSALPGMVTYDDKHLLSQEIFSKDLPVIPLYLSIKVTAARADICNFSLDPSVASELWNIEEISYGHYCFAD